MISDVRIYVVIGLFIIACISLMIFNFVIIRFSRAKHTPSARKTDRWMTILYTETIIAGHTKSGSKKHDKFLLRKLPKTKHLIVYSHALQVLKERFPKAFNDYVKGRYTTFRELAFTYGKRPRIERTCYADFISRFPELAGDSYGQLADVLISYIDDSSIHCRTKVVSALCSIGSAQGVVNTLQIINDKSLFMHTHLLTSELSKFGGDKYAFADRLWSEGQGWNDSLMVSVVQFITGFSNQYIGTFFPALQDKSIGTTVRAAIIRYYEKHPYEPVRLTLIKYLYDQNNTDLAAESALTLNKYPAPDTVVALKNALSNPNWHVRYNASYSLLRTGTRDDLLQILRSDSAYNKEIVAYMLELEYALLAGSQDEASDEDVDI